MWKLKQNKCTRKCSKRGNTQRKWWLKSNQFKRIHVLTSFCLASDPRRKTSVSHASQFEKDRIRASWCSGRKFLPHFPPGSDRCRKQSSIQNTIPVETQSLTLTALLIFFSHYHCRNHLIQSLNLFSLLRFLIWLGNFYKYKAHLARAVQYTNYISAQW